MIFDYTLILQKIEEILDNFLCSNCNENWIKQNFGTLPEGVDKEHFNQLVQPCKNLVNLGGKRWRPVFLVLCSSLISKDSSLAYNLTPVVELVHTASLIHDDIEDSADTRRGKPAAHITWGLDTAINAGSWLYFSAFSAIENSVTDISLKNKLTSLLSMELRRLHLGQAMDIYWHRNASVIPTQTSYTAMVRMKTGTLASLSGKLGIICAGGSDEQATSIGQIASEIGEGFQVLDDVINITTGNKGKKRGDDIVEGKKSLPVILHLQKKPDDISLISEYFTQASKEGINSTAVEKVIQLLDSSNSIQEAKTHASNIINCACNKIKLEFGDATESQSIENLFTSML